MKEQNGPSERFAPPLGMAGQDMGLVLKQPALAVQAAAVAAQAAIGGDDAMAGDDDRDRVLAIRPTDGPARSRLADPPRQLGIGDGAAVGNLAQLLPDPALKWRAGHAEREIEGHRLAFKVGVKLVTGRDEDCVILLPSQSRFRCGPSMTRSESCPTARPGHEEARQGLAVGREQELADRAGQVTVVDSLIH